MTLEEEAFWAGYYAPKDIPVEDAWRAYRKEHPEYVPPIPMDEDERRGRHVG